MLRHIASGSPIAAAMTRTKFRIAAVRLSFSPNQSLNMKKARPANSTNKTDNMNQNQIDFTIKQKTWRLLFQLADFFSRLKSIWLPSLSSLNYSTNVKRFRRDLDFLHSSVVDSHYSTQGFDQVGRDVEPIVWVVTDTTILVSVTN